MLKINDKLLLLISLTILADSLPLSIRRQPDSMIAVLADWLLEGDSLRPEDLDGAIPVAGKCPYLLEIAYCFNSRSAEVIDYFDWINFHYLQSIVVLKFEPMHDWFIVKHWLHNKLERLTK